MTDLRGCGVRNGWRPLKRTRIIDAVFPSAYALGYFLACLRHLHPGVTQNLG